MKNSDIDNYTIRIIKELININTTKSSKNETQAAYYIKEEMKKLGLKSLIFEPYEGKGSIVTVVKGINKDSIVLYSHLDTEDYLDKTEWILPPDKATVWEDRIYGRGAIDCKGLTAIWMGIIKKIVDRKKLPRKTIIFVAASDEESGGSKGIEWIINNTNYFNNTDLVLSEGGGVPLVVNGKTYFTIQTGERDKIVFDKMYEPSELSKKINILPTIERGISKKVFTEETKFYLKQLEKRKLGLNRKIPLENFQNIIIEKEGGEIVIYKMPFIEDKEFLSELNVMNIKKRTASGKTNDLSRYIHVVKRELRKYNENYRVLPYITPGYSDNRYFRKKNINTIGFFPLEYRNNINGIHGHNEFITKGSVELSLEVLYNIIDQIAL